VTRIHAPSIAATMPYPVYGGFGELTRETPRRAEAPQPLPPPEPAEGPHLAYAFQWFLFAALALGGYVLLARREAADQAAASAPPQPARVAAPGTG
jgi:cytochrome oxidase assembly protein ShyY1